MILAYNECVASIASGLSRPFADDAPAEKLRLAAPGLRLKAGCRGRAGTPTINYAIRPRTGAPVHALAQLSAASPAYQSARNSLTLWPSAQFDRGGSRQQPRMSFIGGKHCCNIWLPESDPDAKQWPLTTRSGAGQVHPFNTD